MSLKHISISLEISSIFPKSGSVLGGMSLSIEGRFIFSATNEISEIKVGGKKNL